MATLLSASSAFAEIDKPAIRILVLNDQSSVNSAASGVGSVVAARLAIEDFGGKIGNRTVELVSYDHQNKADVAAALARRAFDVDGVDAAFDFSNSAVSLAVQELARERGKVVVHVGSANADLFGKACSATSALWLYDTYSLAQGIVRAAVQDGGKDWFFLTSDYSFGRTMETEATKVLESHGGKSLGAVRHPPGTADFASFLLQAKATDPQVVGLASGGDDPINIMKQASDFGFDRNKTKFAVFIFALNYVKAMGPRVAQGLQYLSGFYWDRNKDTAAFARRFAAANNGSYPTEMQAANYSAIRHYLRAVSASDSVDGLTVMRKMKALPLDDFFAPGARIRSDGRLMNDQYLLEGKAPNEIKGAWDLLTVRQTIKAADIQRPVEQGGCEHLDEGR
ncbi:ABC transporter substrate-binding protein [Bradyrhizobium liaoningense]